jgi:VWFA-related protein
VKDLAAEDFTLYEDGVRQTVTYFAAGLAESWMGLAPELKEELSGQQIIGLVLDASGSMQSQMPVVQEAALRFLTNIPRTEHLFVVDFDESIRVSEYSSDDQRLIADRLHEVTPGGWTALYDAVSILVERAYPYSGRKTLVVFSEGVDTRSALDRNECLDMVRASDVTIHSIHFTSDRSKFGSRSFVEGSSFLRRVAELTGGSYLFASSLEQVGQFYRESWTNSSATLLGYVSTNPEPSGRYRRYRRRSAAPEGESAAPKRLSSPAARAVGITLNLWEAS